MNLVDFLLNRQSDPKLAAEIKLAEEKARQRKANKANLAANTIKDPGGIRWQRDVLQGPTQLQPTNQPQEETNKERWMQGWEINNDK